MIKENSDNLNTWTYDLKHGGVMKPDGLIDRETMHLALRHSELALSSRLTDETFRGLINFE